MEAVAVTEWTYCMLRWIPLGHHKGLRLEGALDRAAGIGAIWRKGLQNE
jgi:hypothetical protein